MSFVVTIDGPGAAGKSTTARAVAARLGILYLDTGAMYRALALKVLDLGIPLDDEGAVAAVAADPEIDLSGSPDEPHVWLDGRDVSGSIRTPAVSEVASRLAALQPVRRRLVDFQRRIRDRGPLVAEGRDVGTVVFPDAEVKIFLEADLESRARRRCRELQERGIAAALDDVREELERRDARDRTRLASPMRPAEGATLIDTTGMNVGEQIEAVLEAARSHPGCPGAARPAPRAEN